MKKEKIKFNEITWILNSIFDDLLNNPQINPRFVLWKFYAEKNIDSIDRQINYYAKKKLLPLKIIY